MTRTGLGSDSPFRTLFDHSPDGALMVESATTRILLANDSMCRMLGYTPEELGQLSIRDIHPENTLPRVAAEFERLSGAETHFVSAFPVLRKNGSIFLADISSSRFDLDGRPCMLGLFRDITERIETEKQRRASEARLEALFEHSPVAIWEEDFSGVKRIIDSLIESGVTDVASYLGANPEVVARCAQAVKIVRINDTSARFFDSPKEDIPRNLHVYFTSESMKVFAVELGALAAGAMRWEGEIPIRTPHGEDRELRISISVLPGSESTWECVIVSFADITEHNRAVQALRESEMSRTLALEAAQMGTWEWDLATDRHTWSAVQEAIWGYKPGTFTGKSADVLEGVHPADRETFLRAGEKSKLTGEPFGMEFRVVRPDGSERWVSSMGRHLLDAAGQPRRALGVLSDITERRRDEEELRVSRSLLEETGQLAMVGGWEFDPFTLTGRWTDEVARIYDLDPSEPTSVELALKYYKESSRSRIAAAFREAVELGVPYDLELELVSAKGHHKWIRTIGHPVMKDGRVIRVQGSFQDITDHKRAEEALRATEERYRNLVETTYDWIWEVGSDGRYTYASPRVADLLGYAPEEVLGKTPFDLMPPAEADRVREIFAEIAASQTPFRGLKNFNRHKDGRLVTLETSGVPVFGSEGSLLGYRGMDRDVTEQEHLEAQLRQAQKLEAVGQLAGGVAHDFNNILAAIMMQLGLLRMDPNLIGETREAVKELELSAQRAASLTRQLLMFSRRSVLEVKALDLNEVIEHLLKMLRRLLGEQIDLRFEPGSAAMMVTGDSGMLEQVVVNLAVNARDAMPRGGRITIRTERVTVDEQAARQNLEMRPGAYVRLSVIDTGKGMDPETLRRIFEPFFTTKEVGRGTGLGLATVHGIVGQHRGWVVVESEVGKGSVFHVLLPEVAERSDAGLTTDSRPQAPPRGNETILLVEDEPAVRKSTSQLLRHLGYQVIEAGDGREAIAAWTREANRIDLLLTDMVLPGEVSGGDLARQFRVQKPRLKVIIASGYSRELSQRDLHSELKVAYLPKPYDVKVLGNLIRSVIDAPPAGS